MSRPPAIVAESSLLIDVARIMHDKGIGSVIVVDKNGALRGIITERDVVAAVAHGFNPRSTRAWEVMTENPATVREDDRITAALERITETGARHLPVVDDKGKPVGVISFRDIANLILLLANIGLKTLPG
jgi:CBS domain-containing protein